jgi:hypothetical protein
VEKEHVLLVLMEVTEALIKYPPPSPRAGCRGGGYAPSPTILSAPYLLAAVCFAGARGGIPGSKIGEESEEGLRKVTQMIINSLPLPSGPSNHPHLGAAVIFVDVYCQLSWLQT